jgi:hypothetical protein
MSCGCGSSSDSSGVYNDLCNADIPYPSVSSESVPSLISNLVAALYGTITKDVSSGKVVWNIPCDPATAPATVFGIPRNDGEGLLCYFIRAFNAANLGATTFYGTFIGNLTGNVTGTSSIATNLAGGALNSLPYQTASNTTAMLSAGSNGQVLGISSGSLAWVSAPSATSSQSITGGDAGNLVYQSAANTTAFTASGTSNQVLHGNGAGTPTWAAVSASDMASTLDFTTKAVVLPDYCVTTTKIATGNITPDKLSIGAPYWNYAGNLGIGTNNPAYQLQIATDSAAKPSTNTWTIASDARLKENIKPFTKGLDAIEQISPVYYDYNGKAGFSPTKNNVGVIAQDIEGIVPEGISTYKAKLNEQDKDETELLNFNSHALTYILINAIKDLKSIIQTQEAEIVLVKSELQKVLSKSNN